MKIYYRGNVYHSRGIFVEYFLSMEGFYNRNVDEIAIFQEFSYKYGHDVFTFEQVLNIINKELDYIIDQALQKDNLFYEDNDFCLYGISVRLNKRDVEEIERRKAAEK